MTASSPPPRLPASAPIHWLMAAARLVAARPGALLVVSLVLVCGFGALLILLSILVGASMRDGAQAPAPGDLSAVGGAMLPLIALSLIVPQWVCGGLSAVLHALAQGREIGIGTALATLRRRWLALAGLMLLPAALFVLSVLLYRLLGGPEYLQQYMAAAMEASQNGRMLTPPEPAHPGLLTLGLMLVNWVIYALLLLAPTHVAVGGHGPLAAIAAAVRTFIRHLPAMLVAGGLGAMLMMAAAMLSLALLMPTVAVSAAAPLPGMFLALAVMALLGACFALVWSAIGYVAWRTTLGADPHQSGSAEGGDRPQGEIAL